MRKKKAPVFRSLSRLKTRAARADQLASGCFLERADDRRVQPPVWCELANHHQFD
jgi:hypothetical protein